MAAGDRYMTVFLDDIDVRDSHRAVDPEAVKRIAKSIKDIGLQYPITATGNNGRFILVAGRHVEAITNHHDGMEDVAVAEELASTEASPPADRASKMIVKAREVAQ
jgi:ParB-like nuclease domain